MSKTITKQIVMVDQRCASCGFDFMVPDWFDKQCRHYGRKKDIYCPSCRASMSYRESEVDQIKRRLASQEDRAKFWHDEAKRQEDRVEAAERRTSAMKGVVTRLKNRAAAGVCPCCNRTFQNLARHMKSKHPEYAKPASDAIEEANS